MSNEKSFSELRQYIMATLDKLEKEQISIQNAAVIVKAVDTMNQLHRTEMEMNRLRGKGNAVVYNLIASEKKYTGSGAINND